LLRSNGNDELLLLRESAKPLAGGVLSSGFASKREIGIGDAGVIGPPVVVGVPADSIDEGRLGDPLGEFRLKFIADAFGEREPVFVVVGDMRDGEETGCPPRIGPIIIPDKEGLFGLDVPVGLMGDIEGAA
jgi:hypothetical protein